MTSLRREEKVTHGRVTELSRERIISLRALYKVRLADLSSVIPTRARQPDGTAGGTNIYARDLRGAMYAYDIPGYV